MENFDILDIHSYRYLCQNSSINDDDKDKKKFEMLKLSLNVLGFDKEKIFAVFSILSSILWMGNITFNNFITKDLVTIANMEALEITAKHLSINPKLLYETLTRRELHISGEKVLVPFNYNQVIFAIQSTIKTKIFLISRHVIIVIVCRNLSIARCFFGFCQKSTNLFH